MNILIIGGTKFVGRAITSAALDGRHQVTLFHRGKTGADVFPQVERIIGDRENDLNLLAGRRWDVVIDTCAYVPRVAELSSRALADSVDRYVFISTLSVYRDWKGALTEDSPLVELSDPSTEVVNGETYGGLKVLCERAVTSTFGDRATILRPGVIVGPHDPTDRFTYWIDRVARGGETLAPRISGRPMEFIDVRDLADFTLSVAENTVSGVFNAVGFTPPLSYETFFVECCSALNAACKVIWVDEEFLQKEQVEFWSELPLCLPPDEEHRDYRGTDCSRALKRGLRFRPLSETVRDTREWSGTRGVDYQLRAGLEAERELAVLEKWRALQDTTDG